MVVRHEYSYFAQWVRLSMRHAKRPVERYSEGGVSSDCFSHATESEHSSKPILKIGRRLLSTMTATAIGTLPWLGSSLVRECACGQDVGAASQIREARCVALDVDQADSAI